jgi:hypothetical protein
MATVESKSPIDDVEKAPSEASDEERRREFLSSFTPEDDKRIMNKVNRRFLWLIGVIYVIKTVRRLFSGWDED